MKHLILLLVLFRSTSIFATIQIPEVVIIGHRNIHLLQYPLAQHPTVLDRMQQLKVDQSNLFCIQSNCWRGYRGIWEIKNDSLFLVKIENPCSSSNKKKSNYQLSALFDHKFDEAPIFADWVSDTLSQNCLLPYAKSCMHIIIKQGQLISRYEPALQTPSAHPDLLGFDIQIKNRKIAHKEKTILLDNRFYSCLAIALVFVFLIWFYKQ